MRHLMAVLCVIALSAPGVAAGFEVHEIDGPTAPIPPGGNGTITVDLDIDCSSAWLHDPYTIDVAVTSDAEVEGPADLQVPASDCDTPDGIVERFLSYNVTVSQDLPGYVAVPVEFTFTSSDHPLDAAENHNGSATVEPDGMPRIEVSPDAANITVDQQGNVTLTVRNTGNVPVDIGFDGIDVQRLDLPDVPRLEQGGETTATVRFVPQEAFRSLTTVLNITGIDEQGKASPPERVALHWEQEQDERGEESPLPFFVAPVALAVARWLRRD